MELVPLKIGKKVYLITLQARYAFYGLMVIWVVNTIKAILKIQVDKPFTYIIAVIQILFASVAVALGTYSVNCMVIGHCDVYAWIYLVFVLLMVLINLSFPLGFHMLKKYNSKK